MWISVEFGGCHFAHRMDFAVSSGHVYSVYLRTN